ncbi:MAG: carboxypeptidase regulatory-like domain-containing protein [Myxococcales bacterium]|nr:carboxypeptidase regulatory-like domain-containing protein [Myxococcales bacterium]MCB9538782.1 carboxypeptidase regulatory-like domain-containing protein [Myxococcales bacterium]
MALRMLRPLMLAGVALLAVGCGAGPVSIGGRVVDHRGTPIQKAEVVTEPETDVSLTNSRGFFVLRQRITEIGETAPIPPGEYTIKVRKFGFEELAFRVAVEGGPTRVEDLVMQPRTPDIGEAAPEVTEDPERAPDEASTPKSGI